MHTVEIRYAGVAIGRSEAARREEDAGLFVTLPEPLPVGTQVVLRWEGVEAHGRVGRVVESPDAARAGMLVRLDERAEALETWGPAPPPGTAFEPAPMFVIDEPSGPRRAAAAVVHSVKGDSGPVEARPKVSETIAVAEPAPTRHKPPQPAPFAPRQSASAPLVAAAPVAPVAASPPLAEPPASQVVEPSGPAAPPFAETSSPPSEPGPAVIPSAAFGGEARVESAPEPQPEGDLRQTRAYGTLDDLPPARALPPPETKRRTGKKRRK